MKNITIFSIKISPYSQTNLVLWGQMLNLVLWGQMQLEGTSVRLGSRTELDHGHPYFIVPTLVVTFRKC